MTRPRAHPPAPAHPTAAPPAAVPGGHPTPAATPTPVVAAGVPDCRWCAGAGQVLAQPVTGGVLGAGHRVPCACTLGAGPADRRVVAAAAAYVIAHHQAPSVDDLAAATGLTRWRTWAALTRLQTSGWLRRPAAKANRALHLVHPTTTAEETR